DEHLALFFYQFTPLYGHNRKNQDALRFTANHPGFIYNVVLPVTVGCILRADFKNRHFARNQGPHFTGISQKSTFCP
ncbi:MAG: hypothetical protein ACIRZM_09870, partial [Ligilactobacillus ruminis]